MADLPITMSIVPSALTRPILEGQVPVAGAQLDARGADSVNRNSMQMLKLQYDVAEMSLATFTKAREQGVPLVGIPIFPGRRFLQTAVMVAPHADIGDLAELRGKRVGLPQFWMTSSVWHRLVLRQMHGVSQEEVHWVTTAPERMEALKTPPGTDVTLDSSGRGPRELMMEGAVDASMSAGVAGRPDAVAASTNGPRPAFPDVVQAQRSYYERTHILPIMHMIVMKEEIADREPWLVENLCEAFQKAKDQAAGSPDLNPIAGGKPEDTAALMGDDPFKYGLSANRHVLETFLKDVHDQHLIDNPMSIDDLFAKATPDSFR